MTASNAEAFREYQSLAHLLEFLSQLEESESIKEKVIQEVEQKVKVYVKDDGQIFGNNGYLSRTISNSKELRNNILKTEKLNTFSLYNDFQDTDTNKYTEHLINNIFPLFGCLYYMYYECSDDCIKIYGNEWHDERCDGKGGSGNNLNQWLKDETRKTGRMITRGFKQDELSTKTGDDLFPKSEPEKDRSNRLLNYEYGAQLQFALYYMLFLPEKWNKAQSGHAVLFLRDFCEKVSGDQFKDMYVERNGGAEGFKSACQKVQESINTLTGLNIIAPVAADNTTVKYDSLLEATHFMAYIKWLKENLENLIASLTEMKNDASNWDAFKLITSETFGPYPWGFTFKDPNWEQKKQQLQQQLEQQLSQLTEALQTFREKVQSLSASQSKSLSHSDAEESSNSTASTNSAEKPSSSSASTTSTTSNNSTDSTDSNDSTTSTASTIGGVAGGLGAAAATGAAAYAGSGFVGPVAESIGRFFRGLLF